MKFVPPHTIVALSLFALSSIAFSTEPVPSVPNSSSSMLNKIKTAVAESSKGLLYGYCLGENGTLTYVDVTPADRCHNCYSVAKTFTVAAFGMLQDRGLVKIDDPIFPFLKKYFKPGYDPQWEKVTIAHCIKHQTGLTRNLDIDCEKMTSWESQDFLDILLKTKLNAPGTKFRYTDSSYYILSRIFTEITGEKLQDFLRRELMIPMEFSEYAFSVCPKGYFIGATGLYISTYDMAKLGQLYINRGIWNGKRLLSEKFVDEAMARELEFYPSSNGGYSKGGMYAQILYFNPKTGRVFALHSHNADLDKLMELIRKWDVPDNK